MIMMIVPTISTLTEVVGSLLEQAFGSLSEQA